MVDEYQDTNLPQKILIDRLAQKEKCSLNGRWSDHSSNSNKIIEVLHLSLNSLTVSPPKYPSDIQKNSSPKIKKRALNPNLYAALIKNKKLNSLPIKSFKTKNRLNYREIAVLCRNSYHSNSVQIEFEKSKNSIPRFRGNQFIEKMHVKDILAYIKILWNPLDKISWHRILRKLQNIGEVTADTITNEIKHQNGQFTPLLKKRPHINNEEIKLLYETLEKANRISSLVEIFDVIETYYTPHPEKPKIRLEKKYPRFQSH